MAYIVEKDYLSEARGRVTEAFKNKPVFDHYLRLFSEYANTLQEVFRSLGEERWIDTAVGAQLDILGDIVGQDRVILGADLIDYFGYQGALNAQSYGTIYDPSVGGYYKGKNTPLGDNVTLNDDLYRIFIKAKIIKNNTRSTPEDIIKFIQFVFDVDSVWIRTTGYGEASIEIFSDNLTNLEKSLLTYSLEGKNFTTYFVPKTLGVKYNITFVDAPRYFSFNGVANGGTFGDSSDPSVGGIFTSRIS